MLTCRVGRSNDTSGFTLLELVVVMFILTLALGLVLPEATSLLLRNDLKSSSRRLAGAAAYARSQAMLESRVWELTLDLDANAFWANPAGDSDESDLPPPRKRVLDGEVRFLDVQKMPGETKTTGRVALYFHPKGLAEPTVIHLAASGGRVQTVLIKPFNSRSAIHDGYVGAERSVSQVERTSF